MHEHLSKQKMHLKLNSKRKTPVLCDIFVIFSLELFCWVKKFVAKNEINKAKKSFGWSYPSEIFLRLVLLRAWEWASWLLVGPNFREKKRNKKDLLCFNLAACYTDLFVVFVRWKEKKKPIRVIYTYIHLNAHAALAMHLVLIAAALVFAMPITGFGW